MKAGFLIYVVLNDRTSERVTREDCDAAEQAGIIDRTLLPVLTTGHGWADSRKSGYTVKGEIHRSAASFQLLDEGVPIATLAVALNSKSSQKIWEWVCRGDALTEPPQSPWAALRYDIAESALPPWLDWWAKHVGFALMTREGW